MTTAQLTHRAMVVASGPERVEVALASPCGGCKAGCANGPKAGATLAFRTPVPEAPAAGTSVELAVSRSGLAKASALAFGVPLVGWLATTVLVDAYWGETAASLVGLGALGWLLVGVRAFRPALRRWANIELIPLSHE